MATPKKTSSKPAATPKRRGPKPSGEALPNVTGLRMPPELTAKLDAWVEELAKSNPAGRVTRSSLIIHVLREAVARHEASKGGA
jgi:hypothetical protein